MAGATPRAYHRQKRVVIFTIALQLCVVAGCSREAARPPRLERTDPVTAHEPEERAAAPADPAPELPAPEETPRLDRAIDVELGPELRSHDAPSRAPSVVVHAPAGLAADQAGAVVFLHGWSSCARAMAYEGTVDCIPGSVPAHGYGLAVEHDRAGKNSLLVVPQLRWLERRGDPGRFAEPAFFDEWLRAVLDASIAAPLGVSEPSELASITLVAHSAGYETLLAMLRAANVRHVVLFDALYAGADELAAWVVAADDRRIVSLYTGRRGTYRQNQRLATLTASLGDEVAREPSDLAAAIAAHRVVIGETSHGHGAIPTAELANVLGALPLAPRADSSPR
jgi:hypothetical protein